MFSSVKLRFTMENVPPDRQSRSIRLQSCGRLKAGFARRICLTDSKCSAEMAGHFLFRRHEIRRRVHIFAQMKGVCVNGQAGVDEEEERSGGVGGCTFCFGHERTRHGDDRACGGTGFVLWMGVGDGAAATCDLAVRNANCERNTPMDAFDTMRTLHRHVHAACGTRAVSSAFSL